MSRVMRATRKVLELCNDMLHAKNDMVYRDIQQRRQKDSDRGVEGGRAKEREEGESDRKITTERHRYTETGCRSASCTCQMLVGG